jgi:uncharacterized RDD family membrane protein YckC
MQLPGPGTDGRALSADGPGRAGGPRMVTPEAVALEFETANVGSRILGFLIDAAVVGIGVFILFIPVGFLVDPASQLVPDWVVITATILLFSTWVFGYFIAQETLWRGRTLGKAALGLRVVTREGGPVRFRHALIRALLGLVDFGLFSGFVALVAILASPNNQRLGDMVAGTLVLRERSGMRAPAPVAFAPPRGLEQYAAVLDTSQLDAQAYQAVRSFLLRASALEPTARHELAVQLATSLAERLRPEPPSGIPPEIYLQVVAAAHQARQRAAASPAEWGQPPVAPAGWGPPPATSAWGQPPAAPPAGGGWGTAPAGWGGPPAAVPSGQPAPGQPAAGSWAVPQPAAPAPADEPHKAAQPAVPAEPDGGGFTPPA